MCHLKQILKSLDHQFRPASVIALMDMAQLCHPVTPLSLYRACVAFADIHSPLLVSGAVTFPNGSPGDEENQSLKTKVGLGRRSQIKAPSGWLGSTAVLRQL